MLKNEGFLNFLSKIFGWYSKNLYLCTIKTININFNMNKFDFDHNIILNEYLKKEIDSRFLNEMAESKQSFEETARYYGWNLYKHLIFVCVFEDIFSETITHWVSEIRKFSTPIVVLKLKKDTKKLKRSKVIREQMMHPLMGERFEDYDVEEFEKAIKNEKHKAEIEFKKSHSPLYKKEIEVIDSLSSRKIQMICDKNKQRLETFYNNFQISADCQDENMLDDAIQKFVGSFGY